MEGPLPCCGCHLATRRQPDSRCKGPEVGKAGGTVKTPPKWGGRTGRLASPLEAPTTAAGRVIWGGVATNRAQAVVCPS